MKHYRLIVLSILVALCACSSRPQQQGTTKVQTSDSAPTQQESREASKNGSESKQPEESLKPSEKGHDSTPEGETPGSAGSNSSKQDEGKKGMIGKHR
ncbi:hypothetical protein [Gorillibacterium sp. sgz5001074]|uniref:hypothetical protein n=1 Tax=Gorillibacterium sp. sgz5001074 TaxID=3446695 RepID=UPI003F681EBF